jgi:hypothetical protein
MKVLRITAPLAVAAAAAFGPASALAGGDAGPPLYPSYVNVHIVQAESLVQKAMTYEDAGDSANAAKSLTAAKSHMHKAWLSAKFYINHAPPPVAASGSVRPARRPKAKAHSSGGAIPGASPFADQWTTAVGVLTLQHDVAAATQQMLENADATLLPVVSSTLFTALNDRDTAIAYIHKVEPPPVAGSGSVKIKGHSSGAPITSGPDALMPGVVPYLDDELTGIDSIRARVNLSSGRKSVLDKAELQTTKTERTVNAFWPPLPASG